jgi:hypothetical protein
VTASTSVRIAHYFVLATLVASCGVETPPETTPAAATTAAPRPEIYADFALTADLSHLSDSQREMIRVLIEASEIMDDLYWRQAYGDDYEEWLAAIGIDEARRFAELARRSSTQPTCPARKAFIRLSGEMRRAN